MSFGHQARGPAALNSLNADPALPLVFKPTNQKASFDLSVEGFTGPAAGVWMIRSKGGFSAEPKDTKNLLSLRFPISGMMTCKSRSGQFVSQPGQGFALPLEDITELRSSMAFQCLACVLDLESLAKIDADLMNREGGEMPSFEPVVALNEPGLIGFVRSLRLVQAHLAEGLEPQGLLYPLMEEMLLLQFLGVWPRLARLDPAGAESTPSRVVRLALDYIDAHLDQPMSVADIALAAGASVRSLQLKFRGELQQTPVQYIIQTRLDRAHADLLTDDLDSVADIARRWGFVHISDFSRRYRRRFGVTPSETRRQR